MKKNLLVLIVALAVVCAVSIGVMIYALGRYEPKQAPFVPPEFDAAAVKGTLEKTDELKSLGWSTVRADGLPYVAQVCGIVLIEEQEADLWFYNLPESEAWLKLRITDSKGKIVAETGLIKPGEYLQTVRFNRDFDDDEAISMKIMGYEPETYMSAGAVTLNTTVKNG